MAGPTSLEFDDTRINRYRSNQGTILDGLYTQKPIPRFPSIPIPTPALAVNMPTIQGLPQTDAQYPVNAPTNLFDQTYGLLEPSNNPLNIPTSVFDQTISSNYGGNAVPGFNSFSYAPTDISTDYGLNAPTSLLDIDVTGINSDTSTEKPISKGIKWTGKDGVLIPGLNALSNLASAYTGYKQYGLAKDTFDFNLALTKRNLANQAKVTNAAIEDRARGRLSQEGGNIPNLDRLVANQTADRKIKGTL